MLAIEWMVITLVGILPRIAESGFDRGVCFMAHASQDAADTRGCGSKPPSLVQVSSKGILSCIVYARIWAYCC